jgi:hypothetical protein
VLDNNRSPEIVTGGFVVTTESPVPTVLAEIIELLVKDVSGQDDVDNDLAESNEISTGRTRQR